MLMEQTLDKLYIMKLNGMADALQELIGNGFGRRTDA